MEGFNPDRVKSVKSGIETTLGGTVATAAILDKDYRSDGERSFIEKSCRAYCDYMTIHGCKEIENFLLVPAAIDRAASRKVAERAKRSGMKMTYSECAAVLLRKFANDRKAYVTAQYLASRRQFERTNSPGLAEASVNEAALLEFDES